MLDPNKFVFLVNYLYIQKNISVNYSNLIGSDLNVDEGRFYLELH
jgi:hypothetical protein